MLKSVKITEMGTQRKIDMLPPDKRGKLFQRGRISIDEAQIERLAMKEPTVMLKNAVDSEEFENYIIDTSTSAPAEISSESYSTLSIDPGALKSTMTPNFKTLENNATTVISTKSLTTDLSSLNSSIVFGDAIPHPIFCNKTEAYSSESYTLSYGCNKSVLYAFCSFDILLFLMSFFLNSTCIKRTWKRWRDENKNARKNLMIMQPKIKHMALWKTIIAISSILFCASHVVSELLTFAGILREDGQLSMEIDVDERLAFVLSPLTDKLATVLVVVESLAWFINHWHSILLILVSLTFLGEIDKLMKKKKKSYMSNVSSKIGTSFFYAGILSGFISLVPIILLVLVGIRTNGDFVRINQVTLSPSIVGDELSETITFWTMLVFFVFCPGMLSIILSLAALQKVKCHIRCREEEAENYSWNIPKKSLDNFRKYLLEVILRATFNFVIVVFWFFSVDWDPKTHYYNPIKGISSHIAWKLVVCLHSVPIFLKIPDFVGSIYQTTRKTKSSRGSSPKQAVQKTISIDTQKTNFSSDSSSS